MPDLSKEPLLAGLVGADEQGEPAAHPLLGLVLEHLKERPDGTCYAALLEALTGIWNAAVRGAVVARLRASGLPADDLLLRLEALSPTLGFQAEKREWARAVDGGSDRTGRAARAAVRGAAAAARRGLAGARARPRAARGAGSGPQLTTHETREKGEDDGGHSRRLQGLSCRRRRSPIWPP